MVIYSLQRFFASLLSKNDNNRSIRKFLAKLEIPYDKELFKKLFRSAEQFSSSKDNSAKYAISSIQRTKGLESKVCVLILTPAIFKYLMQDGVTKYNKTWNIIYVALTRAEIELIIAVDMDLFGEKHKLDDITKALESIGFKVKTS